jgi:hypothetical protein
MRMHSTPALSIRVILGAFALVLLSGCNYGILGKKPTQAVDKLDSSVVGSINQAKTDAIQLLTQTRDTLLDFLNFRTEKEAHDISVGLLKGTIGYLAHRDRLARLLESIIDHAGSAAREQLIAFKNDLLGPQSIDQIRQLLRTVMHELILRPADNLLTIALSNTTREQLNKLLRMVIPAILNDSAIGQIAKLRNVLLGYNMKKDIAGWVDTALYVANARLDSPLRKTINSIVDQNTSTIRKDAVPIIIGLGILAIIIGLVVYWVQHKKVELNQSMLQQVTMKIEDLRTIDPDRYKQLTTSIQQAMLNHELEHHMNSFLKERKIS